jgi:hypothetical protein
LFPLGEQRNMSQTTTCGKTPSPPRPMTAEAIERAARADRDAQPLTETDLKRMKRTPQAKIIRRALQLDARGIRRPLSHSPRHAA